MFGNLAIIVLLDLKDDYHPVNGLIQESYLFIQKRQIRFFQLLSKAGERQSCQEKYEEDVPHGYNNGQ